MPFQQATNSTHFAKVGIFGFEKAGKTWTSIDIAIGLAKASKKPAIAMIDTETGSDWHIDRVHKELGPGSFFVRKTRAFAETIELMDEAEEIASVLLIDSVTHIAEEMRAAFKARRKIQEIRIQHIMPLRDMWSRFATKFINGRTHTIVCGRAGWVYTTEVDEETEKRSTIKSGTKMRSEGEFGYEPSLLIEMERAQDLQTHKLIHRAHVFGDRSGELEGRTFINPTYADFVPFFARLSEGDHVGVDESVNSEHMFPPNLSGLDRDREIAIETLKAELVLSGLDGQSSEVKHRRIETLMRLLGTASAREMERLDVARIRQACDTLRKERPENAGN